MPEVGEGILEEERLAWLRLIRSPGLGAQALRDLVIAAGSAVAAEREVLRGRAPAAPDAARAWLANSERERIDADRQWLAQPGHHLLTWTDPRYPALLREAPRAPAALFVRGNPDLLWHPQLAVVGSRNPTAGGADNARAFAATLARSGLAITSGLAGGIDAAAHHGALAADGVTIAVVGTGVDIAYPASNAALAETIAARGVIVSEFPPGTAPRPQHFPQRNRIIAGLSLGTLVVEAALRSGSLITARLASESGREVFALPGSIHNPMARGCHRLIRDGAKLVETANEIVDELRPLAQQLREHLHAALATVSGEPSHGTDDADVPGGVRPAMSSRLDDPDYRALWEALGHDLCAVDTLAARTGLTTPAISSMLLLMELDGLITVGANGRYGRAGRDAG